MTGTDKNRRRPPSGPLVCKATVLLLAALCVFFGSATPAQAVQSHGGIEGLSAHQIGHLLFTAGMTYLLLRIGRAGLRGHGWGEFRLFLWLMIGWNLLTFTGHWINVFVTAEHFVKTNGQTLAFRIGSAFDAVFYLAQLDHLVLVPAMACLLLALRKWGVSR